MFEDIYKKEKKIHGHWRRCPCCGMVFDVDQDGEECPVCSTSNNFEEISDEEMEEITKKFEDIDDLLPSEESPYP